MHKVTLGGDRLGSGNRMKVDLKGYDRSNHDQGYIFRSTTSAGTLVPFMKLIGLPGASFNIYLDMHIMTHPTIGPLLGSYKAQADVFLIPIRLYQAQLHNNKLNVGRKMANVKLPLMNLQAIPTPEDMPRELLNTAQINPSCIHAYLGIRGVGSYVAGADEPSQARAFNATAFIGYWDVVKNYYSNKQEEIGGVIHTPREALVETVDSIQVLDSGTISDGTPVYPGLQLLAAESIDILYTGTRPIESQILFNTSIGVKNFLELTTGNTFESAGEIIRTYNHAVLGNIFIHNWYYQPQYETTLLPPRVVTFPLTNIDTMREEILERATSGAAPVVINEFASNLPPYQYVIASFPIMGISNMGNTQEGLAVKTYQSDIFNNWLSEEWIDGVDGINEITAVSTAGDSFQIDALLMARKVYDLLNRVAVSDGTYRAWLQAAYDHTGIFAPDSPIYHGGLIKELVFEEIVSNAEASNTQGTQPLGTLAGKGRLSKKHKGGHVIVKCDEPCIVMGIFSLTPRIDYSQGNDWDVHLRTMDDFHKPGLDNIGFQDLITEQMAWWDTHWTGSTWLQKSAGKQPAWLNYMTNFNKTYGNFAIEQNEMFMTLNRKYEPEFTGGQWQIADLTTYIDPAKYNHIFAQTSLDAQNFWVQIAVDVQARRKMSAKLMPNL